MSASRAPFADGPGVALIVAAGEAEAAAIARAAAAAEIGRPIARRLDEAARARAAIIARTAIEDVSAQLRAAEPMLDGPHVDTLPDRLADAGLIALSGLAAASLARADEYRLAAALAHAADGAFDASDEGFGAIDAALGRDRAAVREAEAARLDRAGEPLLPLHDIPAEERHALFWHVAACLAHAAIGAADAAPGAEDAVHRAAAAAVARTLAAIDDGTGIAAAALRLAHGIEQAGGLDDDRIAGTLAAGQVSLLAAMLAVRGGIGIEAARAMLGHPARLAVLLRACEVERDVAAAMIVAVSLACSHGGDPLRDVAALTAAFDALPPGSAAADIRRFRLEPCYRDALAALGTRS